MTRSLFILASIFAAICSLFAKPVYYSLSTLRTDVNNGIVNDGPAVLSGNVLDTLSLYCPFGIQEGPKAKNILLIHGTGCDGNLTWNVGLPFAFHQRGYSSCWINLPNLSLSDAQLTGEYVMHYIRKLYQMSGNTPIFLLGHSQGNLNIQWALNFFPSIRKMVSSFVSYSGDFQGTDEGPLISAVQNRTMHGTMPSLLQQSVILGKKSNFLQALNRHGNMALVPTTSIYGEDDEVIQLVGKATMLGSGGAPFTHTSVQKLCPDLLVDHAVILINRVAFYLTLDAFDNGSNASVPRVQQRFPDICKGQLAPDIDRFALAKIARLAFDSLYEISSNGRGTIAKQYRTRKEPELVPYALHQP